MAEWPYTTQRWQRVRRLKLQEHPLCQACLQVGKIEPAAAVDHRTPIKRGGDPFPELEQLASLCARCHNQKTRCEQTGEDYLRKGCDVFGHQPLQMNAPAARANAIVARNFVPPV
jgi:5-methylcytosine-specific restriction endonuclease McrA